MTAWFEHVASLLKAGEMGTFQVLATGLGFTEAPVYDPMTQSVLFSDVRDGGVWELTSEGRLGTVVPHRRGIGGMVINGDGALIVGGRNIAAKTREGETVFVVETDDVGGRLFGFNGLCADDQGRVYAGGLGWDPFETAPTGALGGIYVLDPDGSCRVVYEDVVLPNGMAYDAEGARLFVCDSQRRQVVVFRRRENGNLDRERHIDLGALTPDGMARSSDGRLWIACVHDGAIIALDENDGAVTERLATPVHAVTSLCFGLGLPNVLCVTGGELDQPAGGGLWATRVTSAAAPVFRAQLVLSGSQ